MKKEIRSLTFRQSPVKRLLCLRSVILVSVGDPSNAFGSSRAIKLAEVNTNKGRKEEEPEREGVSSRFQEVCWNALVRVRARIGSSRGCSSTLRDKG